MITYTTVRDLVWCNAEHTQFNCYVFFEHTNKEAPFGCAQSEVGVYPHVASIWERAMAGEFGVIAEYVPPPFHEAGVAAINQPTTTGSQTL
jgi:hypothetical protein